MNTNHKLRISKESIIKHEQQVVAIMIALQPSSFSVMFQKFSKEEIKKYFAKIRLEYYERIKAEEERLKKLEKLRFAALNKEKKVSFGMGKEMSMSMFRKMMNKDESNVTMENNSPTTKLPTVGFNKLRMLVSPSGSDQKPSN